MPRIRVENVPSVLTEPEIERLVLQYTREMARYEKAAEIVANRLRRELRAEARLRHLISFRAKHPDDLHEKLRRKAMDPRYSNYDDLRENLNSNAPRRVFALRFDAEKKQWRAYDGGLIRWMKERLARPEFT